MRVCTKGFLSANGVLGKVGADPHPSAELTPSPKGRLFYVQLNI